MKKKITAIFLCIALAATAIVGASLAYFTDTDSAENTFTVGNVSIALLESQFHREGNENSNATTIDDPMATAKDMEYVTDGNMIFTDDEIKEDAETYQADYLGVYGRNLVPGVTAAKCVYVENTGANDAYIRIRVMIPEAGDWDGTTKENLGAAVISSQWCTSSITSGEFASGYQYLSKPAIKSGVQLEENGIRYNVYTFVRNEPLAADALTEWNVWNYVGLAPYATEADIEAAIEAGVLTRNEATKEIKLNILVQADAIQAKGFENATDAFKAFDAKK